MITEKDGIKIEERLYEPAPDEIAATERLVKIVRILRRLCPWDSVQTHDSLRICMLEEAYEAVDAVINQDMDNFREELGDVMLQVLINGVIAEESGTFSLTEVINEECDKMIRRHPHIFADAGHKDIDKILERWENIKGKEHGNETVSDRLAGIPKALPALMRANKIMTKVSRADMVPEDFLGGAERTGEPRVLLAKQILSEAEKLRDALQQGDDCIETSIGELLFLTADAARIAGIDPEAALNRRAGEFVERFRAAENTGESEHFG